MLSLLFSLLHVILYLLVFLVAFFIWVYLFTKARPLHISRDEADTNFSGEREIRTVTAWHAFCCTCVLLLHLHHGLPSFVLSWAKLVSIAYLLFDLWMTHYIRMDLGEKEAATIMKGNPWKLALHHIGTILFLYDYPFYNEEFKCLILYYWAEVPMVFVNVAWYLMHTKQGNTPFCHAIRVIEILTYFFCRVIMMPLYLVFNLLPFFHPSVFGFLMLFVYLYIYIETLQWFRVIVTLNREPLTKALCNSLQLGMKKE
jgi:hypothetical protein